MAAITGFGHCKGTERVGSGLVQKRGTGLGGCPASPPENLLDDVESLLVSADEATEVPADAGHIISVGLKDFRSHVRKVNTW